MSILNNNDVLLYFSPCWRDNLCKIWTSFKTGISSFPVKVLPYISKNKEDVEVFCSHFMIELPFAGRILSWNVYLNEENYDFPPDFDFGNDEFLSNPDIDVINNNLPSMATWNVNNPIAFMSILNELLMLYKKYQIDKINTERKFKTLSIEYAALINNNKVLEEDIEIYVDAKESVHMLINLHGKFEDLPIYTQQSSTNKEKVLNACKDKAMLKISIIGARMQPALSLSPRLEQTLGNASTLLIPPIQKFNGLVEYIPAIQKLIDERVEVIENRFKFRKEYISNLLSLRGLSVVEYDNINFSQIVFLTETSDFYCLVDIELHDKFPIEKPKIMLHSIFHEMHSRPYSEEVENYPYSPRWSTEKMVNMFVVHLEEAVEFFKTNSIQFVAS